MTQTMPVSGTAAPDFAAPDADGNTVRLQDLRGKWVVLFFYPKDDTPGCTREACSFRDHYAAIQATGAVVLGVSGGTETSHAKFARKHELPFPLLVDADHAIARAYGAWGTKRMYGREYEGIIRSTFIVDPEGNIAKTWPKVKPDEHGAEVFDWLNSNASS